MKISNGILRQAVVLSERYITDRFLPDKAIDLLDEACSDLNLKDPDISRRMEIQRELDDYEKGSGSCWKSRPLRRGRSQTMNGWPS